jgi:hypothetical protein
VAASMLSCRRVLDLDLRRHERKVRKIFGDSVASRWDFLRSTQVPTWGFTLARDDLSYFVLAMNRISNYVHCRTINKNVYTEDILLFPSQQAPRRIVGCPSRLTPNFWLLIRIANATLSLDFNHCAKSNSCSKFLPSNKVFQVN